jgi:hypothetical protein
VKISDFEDVHGLFHVKQPVRAARRARRQGIVYPAFFAGESGFPSGRGGGSTIWGCGSPTVKKRGENRRIFDGNERIQHDNRLFCSVFPLIPQLLRAGRNDLVATSRRSRATRRAWSKVTGPFEPESANTQPREPARRRLTAGRSCRRLESFPIRSNWIRALVICFYVVSATRPFGS